MGLTRPQRTVIAATPAVLAVGAGAVLALVGAWGVSGAFPAGRARAVEPDPGPLLDGAALLVGGAATLAVGGLLAVGVAARRVRPAVDRGEVGRLARAAARGPAPASAAVHLATRRGVPARPAVAGAVVALASAVAAASFGASLSRFLDDPAQDGGTWDVEVGIGDDLDDDQARAVAEELAERPDVGAVSVTRLATLDVDGKEVQVVGLEPVAGDIALTVLEGEPPRGPREVALGPETADDLGVSVGEGVELEGSEGRPHRFEVTALVRFPNLAEDNPARGITLPLASMTDLLPPDPVDGRLGYPALLLRWAPGVAGGVAADGLGYATLDHLPSNQAASLREVQPLPGVLVGVMGVLGLAAVAHALVVAVRRSRRDLAVLATVGFDRRQRRRVVLTQALGYVTVGLLVGGPLGVVLGRGIWRVLADQLAVNPAPVVPVSVALVIPAALVVAVLVTVWPARSAVRVSPAAALRVE